MRISIKQLSAGLVLTAFALANISCAALAKNEAFYGKTQPPPGNVLRYSTGDEPESLDPQMSTGQPEARIFMALYEGLVEYDPRSLEPKPAIAERWDENNDSSEFVFHLRKNARWSNGDPISAHDFVYSLQRGLTPQVTARGASLAYYVKYARAYNQGAVFVRDKQTNAYLLASDFAPASNVPAPLSERPLGSGEAEYKPTEQEPKPDPDTPFHQFMHSPERLTLPGGEKPRNDLIAKNPKLKAVAATIAFVKVAASDVGIEAVDNYTIRISLSQSAPFFKQLLANQFFRLVPKKAIEQYDDQWTQPNHIVTCGPFKVKRWKPYDELVLERDPMYWDQANVGLDGIAFFPGTDLSTVMNLYKVGDLDAVQNHCVPAGWMEVVRLKKDYMDAPEAGSVYININTTKAPMNDVRVRKAFDMAINKSNWLTWKKIVKPLTGVTPTGIFAGYPAAKGNDFNPEKGRQLLAEAGFPVTRKNDGSYSCPTFPVDQVEYAFPTATSNKVMAEFMQAQWKQNLGITVPLRSMESRTFFGARAALEYKGLAFGGWGADYMDPFTFLSLYYTPENDNCTGWWDKKYVDMLDEANRIPDRQKRFDLLARAEQYMVDAQPIIPIETSAVNWVKKPYVKGMYPNAVSLYPWKYVYIERDSTKWDYGTPRLTD